MLNHKKTHVKFFDEGGFPFWLRPLVGSFGISSTASTKRKRNLPLALIPKFPVEARQRRDEARTQLTHGIDPGTVRKVKKNAGTEETAHRMRGLLGQIFRYAVATGRAERDPTADLRGALPQPIANHHSAITVPKEVVSLLRALDGYQGHFVVKCVLRLAPLLFVRPGEPQR
jgi:hypothetical protein